MEVSHSPLKLQFQYVKAISVYKIFNNLLRFL